MKYLQTIPVALAALVRIAVAAPGEDPNPMVIDLEIPAPDDSAGGIVVADINDDGKPDFLVTVPGHLAAYDNSGRKLWVKQTDLVVGGQGGSQGRPGDHGPGGAGGGAGGDGPAGGPVLSR